MYKDGTFSSLFDHLSKEDKDWYAQNAGNKNSETDWSFSDESLANLKNEAQSLIDKVSKGELDNEEAAHDLYTMYALLTDANFHNDAREIAKLAHDFYDSPEHGDWDDEYIPDSDESDESDDKPHEEDILPDGEESELEKKMTPEEFKIASNITGRSTGDFEPETPEDVQFMLEANKNGLKVSDERLKNVQSNSITSIANTLKNYRW